MSEPVLLTREELYEMVWAEPVSRVAVRLSVSDVGVAKVCRKLNVPRPPRGYWARLQHGYAVNRQPLPPSGDETPQEYLLQPQEQSRTDAVHLEDAPSVPIPEKLSRAHQVLGPIKAQLSKRLKDSYGRVGASDKGIHVTPQTLPRAVRVLTILFNFLEKRGHKISVQDGELHITVSGEMMRIAAFEPTKRLLTGKSTYGYQQYDYKPTGALTLNVSVPKMYRIKRQGADRKNKPIEARLGEIVGYIESVPGLMAAQRHEDQLREQQWERECLVRRRENDRIRFTQGRARTVDKLVKRLRKTAEIRALIAEIDRDPNAPLTSKRLARWASQYADHLDPLKDFRIAALETKPNPYY